MTRTATLVAALALASAASLARASEGPSKATLTPWGRHDARCVHGVPDGAAVEVTDDGFLEARDGRTGALLKRVRTCASQGISWPGAADRFVGRHGGAPAPEDNGFDDDNDGSGWQVYVHQKAGGGAAGAVTKLLGKWGVPPIPAQEAQTLFMFTGAQNIDWVPPQPSPSGAFDIIQPVLQYGSSSAGEKQGWSIASWYVTLTSDVVFSELKAVNPGDMLFGNMTKTGPTSWWINTVDTTTGTTSGMTIKRPLLSTQPWIYVTLEVYDVDSCQQYPPKGTVVHFTDIELELGGKPATPDWSVGTQGQSPPICGAKIAIKSPSAVDITF